MVVAMYLLVILWNLTSQKSDACRFLTINARENTIELIRMPLYKQSQLFNGQYVDSGRAIYESSDGHYLYHLQRSSSGIGLWVVSGSISENINDARFFKESWAVEPALSGYADSPVRSSWNSASPDNQPHSPLDLQLECVEESDTVFFESSATLQPQLTGFYVARDLDDAHSAVVYTLIKHNLQDKPTYLFHLPPVVECTASVAANAESFDEQQQQQQQRCHQTTTWLVGDRYGVDAGLAYSTVTREVPASEQLQRVQPPPRDAEWRFVQPGGQPWTVDNSAALLSTADRSMHTEDKSNINIFELMQSVRSVAAGFPSSQRVKYLRNAVPVPQVGLGTGGVYLEDALDVFTDALSLGYRLFDLAREYGNEHVIPQALQRAQELQAAQCEQPREERDFPDACDSQAVGARPVQRRELFLQSKVWPTELGYEPTSAAIATSLRLLQSNYVDLYMLHWPACDASIDWMHCDTTVDPAATWRESWRALERAYAEGRVLSLGASNFNEDLLEELHSSVATVLPHVVQNWAEPGQVDTRVRAWCDKHSVHYQPYAPLRNIKHLSQNVRQKLQQIAHRENVSEHSVVLQFFLQTGALVIPRSSSWRHLQSNIINPAFFLPTDDMFELGWNL